MTLKLRIDAKHHVPMTYADLRLHLSSKHFVLFWINAPEYPHCPIQYLVSSIYDWSETSMLRQQMFHNLINIAALRCRPPDSTYVSLDPSLTIASPSTPSFQTSRIPSAERLQRSDPPWQHDRHLDSSDSTPHSVHGFWFAGSKS